jgi:hypothetical protein
MPSTAMPNADVAAALDEVAELFETQGANPFRVKAYRDAAETVRGLSRPVGAILAERGTTGLIELPRIGVSIARSIEQLVHAGRLPLLERLRGVAGPEAVIATVPGLGPQLAARIHEALGVENLHDLEAAAWDGRLARVPGLGRRRIQAIREGLAGRFHRRAAAPAPTPAPDDEPPVTELLDVDQEYRRKAEAQRLPTIAPRRFNPTGQSWLPILHTHRGDRHYSALFSNTARAHELGTTHDWVVIYRDDHDGRGQWTVITSRFGRLRGLRIVRGRERECEAHYGASIAPASGPGATPASGPGATPA